MSTHLHTRLVQVIPGDELRMNDRYKVELLPGHDYSGLRVSHDGKQLVFRFDHPAYIKVSLEYERV